MAAKQNWTAEQADAAAERYLAWREQTGSNEDIGDLADELGRSKRSLVSKLARMGVYIKDEPKMAAPKPQGPTHKELGAKLETLGVPYALMQGATKAGLQAVIEALEAAQAVD